MTAEIEIRRVSRHQRQGQDTVHGNLANRKGKSKCGTIYLQLIRSQLLVGQGEEIELPVLPYKALTQVTAMTSDKTCHFVQDR